MTARGTLWILFAVAIVPSLALGRAPERETLDLARGSSLRRGPARRSGTTSTPMTAGSGTGTPPSGVGSTGSRRRAGSIGAG